MNHILNVCFAYKYWRKNAINIFDEPNHSWFRNENGEIANKDFNNQLEMIAKKYEVLLEELLAIISEASDREITKSFQGLGGCVYKRNNLTTILKNTKRT